ncbi:MAG: isoprenylcysteine carboxylmethyltransferase family protein [Candidatus Aminicenantes bacterium]|nr:isoprenylcysteine carboxylmethyltransferase family protein [Candidatus Aminicenantes bacterium]
MSLIPSFKIGIGNAWLFMSVFILQMIAITFVDKHARNKSHIPNDMRKNRRERYTGTIGNFIWLAAMGYSVFLPLQPGTTWFYVGLSVFFIGISLLTIATYNFITTPANQLITKGLYRFSRHPMYLSTFLICLGTGIASLSWLFIFLSIILALCLYQEGLIEERFCHNKYDNAYQEYADRTFKWIGLPKKR